MKIGESLLFLCVKSISKHRWPKIQPRATHPCRTKSSNGVFPSLHSCNSLPFLFTFVQYNFCFEDTHKELITSAVSQRTSISLAHRGLVRSQPSLSLCHLNVPRLKNTTGTDVYVLIADLSIADKFLRICSLTFFCTVSSFSYIILCYFMPIISS